MEILSAPWCLVNKEIKRMKDAAFIENNLKVVEEFRANRGKIAGGSPLILMTTKGAKTGLERVYPLMAIPYDDSYLAVASKGGAPKHPQWYHNLLAHPDITVEVGTEKFPARAELLSGEERAKAFAKAAQVFPPYSNYQQKTAREIPVFLLKRVKGGRT
jgi:F420H(2)-dependent quinone reductase